MRSFKWLGIVLSLLVVAGVAVAQSVVTLRDGNSTTVADVYTDGDARGTPRGLLMLGDDGTNIQTLGVTTGGALTQAPATHGACTNTVVDVGATAESVPATALSGRRSLTICLSETGTTTVTCEMDGAAAVAATGVELQGNDCVGLNLADSVAASCICSAASCDVRTVECP